MKTKLIIISLLLIAVGFITGCVAVGLSGGGFVLDSDETLNTYTVEEAFESISLTDETGDILVKTSEDGICRLECLESKRFQYEIKVESGTLSVKRVENYFQLFDFNFHIDDPVELTVYLPAGEYKNLSVNSDTSDVILENTPKFENVNISLSTGDVKSNANADKSFTVKVSTGHADIKGADSKIISVTATTGDVSVENISASSELSVTTDTGEIRICEIVSGKITLKSSTGDQTVKKVTCESLSTNCTTGDVNCASVTASGSVSHVSGTGSVRFEDFAAESLTTLTSTGEQTFVNAKASGALNITADTGDVKFDRADAAEIKVKTDTGDVRGTLSSPKIFYVDTETGDVDYPKSLEGGLCEIKTDTGDVNISIAN